MNVGILDDGQRLREGLAVNGEAHGIFSRQGHGADFGFANAPMQNLARIATAETALFPDMGISLRCSAERDELRRIVKEIPDGAVHARASRLAFELANDGASRIEDFNFWRSLGRSFQGISNDGAAVGKKAKRIARGEKTHGNVFGFLRHLFDRRDVVEDVDAAAVGRDDEIAELFLDDGPSNWGVR